MGAFKWILNSIPRPWLIRLSYLARPLLVWYYKGNRFIDPIDGKKFRKMLPYGYQIQRQNALSPSTLSLERHRLLWLYLKEKSNFFNTPLKVLHIAPEQCFYGRFKSLKHLDYTTADLNSPLADVKADVCKLPFDSNTFDVVLCNHVLEHITDDTTAMKELYRVLKKGGFGIFQVPMSYRLDKTLEDPNITSKEDRIKHYGQYDHVRLYGLDYFEKLKKVGFKVQQIPSKDLADGLLINTYCLSSEEILPVCFK